MLAILSALSLAQMVEWPVYGGDAGGTRFSAAKQIHRTNVARLKEAWRINTGGLYQPQRGKAAALETTPLYVNGTLYLTSALGRVIAADPATGKQRWTFDPQVDPSRGYGDFTNRGVSYHASGLIIGVTVDARLFVLDAKDGKRRWEVNLREGLRIAPQEFPEYEQTSPPCIIGDRIVIGSAVADNGRTDMPSGEIRAYDVRSGKLLWTWDPAPNTRMGGANAWSVIVADERRGLVFVPTGSASPDYYGGRRTGLDQYANSVLALEAATGKLKWSFQTVHHDLWDYDVASPPALVKVRGQDAVAVGSKTGHLFLLDRDTGRPLFPVEERPVPASDAEGEQASPTQPFPAKPPSLSPHQASLRPECSERAAGLRNEGIFTPPSERGSLLVPGNIGGLHWGGVSYDPGLGLIVAPSNNVPAIVRLVRRDRFRDEQRGDKFDMEFTAQTGTPYGMARQLLLGTNGTPCQTGPAGFLTAVDTTTGEIRWQTPLTLNLGGPISTAGGLTFLGATVDGFFRAFDTGTGKQLWQAKLPASARSTPMTYVHQGRQYVVISAGGHDPKLGPLGDAVVAFALPEPK